MNGLAATDTAGSMSSSPFARLVGSAETEGRLVTALWYLAVALAAWSCGYTPMRGSDLWWHLANGQWILEHRAIPLTDPWSFTRPGAAWNNEAWLSGLLFELWRRLFGLAALVWWKWLVIVSTWLFLFHTVRRTSHSSVAAFVAVVFGGFVAAPFLDIRPQLYSFLAYSLLLHLALGRERPSWALPVVFLVWANLHALVVFGLIVLPILLAPALRRQATRLALLAAACFGAVLVNPLGTGVLRRALDLALRRDSPFRSVGEWRPPFQTGGLQSPLYPPAIAIFAVAAILTIVLLRRRWREVPWVALGLGVLTLAMSLTSRRFVPLFAMSQALVFGPALARLVPRAPLGWLRLALPAAALAFGGVLLQPYPQSSDAFLYLTAQDTFPVELCNQIATSGISGSVFAYYNWGGYLHLRTRGALKVYIDGRADMVYDAETYRRYVRVLKMDPDWLGIVEGSGAQLVLWPRKEPMVEKLIGTGRWRLLHQDAVAVLLLGPAAAAPQHPQPAPVTAWSELAAGALSAEQNRLESAERHYRRALQRMPNLSMACYGLAETEAKQHRLDEALAQARACQRIYPDTHRAKELGDLVEGLRREQGQVKP